MTPHHAVQIHRLIAVLLVLVELAAAVRAAAQESLANRDKKSKPLAGAFVFVFPYPRFALVLALVLVLVLVVEWLGEDGGERFNSWAGF